MLNQNRPEYVNLPMAGLITMLALVVFAAGTFCAADDLCWSETHYDGSQYYVPGNKIRKSFWDLLKWKLKETSVPWPNWVERQEAPSALSEVMNTKRSSVGIGPFRAMLVNHASVLLQFGALNVLTDPVYSERVGLWSKIGPKRHRAPGLSWEQLPKISVVIISHNHYDHMDEATIVNLWNRYDPLFIVPKGNAETLKGFGVKRVVELEWWQTTKVEKLSITLVPAQHWSKRGLFDTNKALWGGYVLQTEHTQKQKRRKVFFAGDTGYNTHFRCIAERLGTPDLSLLPIGAYEPRWFMKPQHMNPADAAKAHLDLKSKKSMAIHFGTFHLAKEGILDPINDLHDAIQKENLANGDFIVPDFGQWYSF